MGKKSVIVTGATGMVGGAALRACLADDDVGAVTTLGRRPTGLRDPKLREIVHSDFLDFASVRDALKGHDVALYCLGVYNGTVSDEEFRKITVDYTVAFARALKAQSPKVAFCFLSSRGADQSERSRWAYCRHKGAAEKALLDVGLARVHIFRPSYIYPVQRRRPPTFNYRVYRMLYPAIRALGPDLSLTSEQLGEAMLEAGLHGCGEHTDPVLENAEIRDILGV